MTTKLFHLPPEILLQILQILPLTPLLRFAQTSRYARTLAYSNVQNLSLAIYPSHRNSWYNKLFATHHKPRHALAAAVQIPRAWDFNYSTLAVFHDKIIASIVDRHAFALQRLDLTLWRLSMPIAKALIQLPALRELSIHIETVQAVPRTHMTMQRKEEIEAWSSLASNPAFMTSINTLTVNHAEINATQLDGLLARAERLQEVRLSRCDMLTSDIWSYAQLHQLHHLSLTDCTNVHVDDAAVDAISKMVQLQVRELHPKHFHHSYRG